MLNLLKHDITAWPEFIELRAYDMNGIESPAISRIINAEIILQHFGYWPSFHDAVIEKMMYEVYHSITCVTFIIVALETTNEVEERGYYKQIKHCDIELQFRGVQEMSFSFDHLPVIFDLAFEERDDALACLISSSAEDAYVVAKEIVVKSLTPTFPVPDEPLEAPKPDELMDAKNIFISSQHQLKNLAWSDLIYIGLDHEKANEYKTEKVAACAYKLFDEPEVYVVIGRHDSHLSTLDEALSKVSTLLKTTDVLLCDRAFTKAMQFNKIGVMSYGQK